MGEVVSPGPADGGSPATHGQKDFGTTRAQFRWSERIKNGSLDVLFGALGLAVACALGLTVGGLVACWGYVVVLFVSVGTGQGDRLWEDYWQWVVLVPASIFVVGFLGHYLRRPVDPPSQQKKYW